MVKKIENEREGEGNKGEVVGVLSRVLGTKDYLWIERRQTWHIGGF